MGIKIALVTPWKVRCGIYTYSADLAFALAQEDAEIFVVRLPRFGFKDEDIIKDIAERVPFKEVDIVHCFVEGTPILTTNGLNKIEAVNEGMQVYTHTGQIGKVLRCFKRHYEGNIIQMRAKYNTVIKCTPEHPFLIIKKPWKDNHTTRLFRERQRKRVDTPNLSPQWIQAKDIVIGDYVVVPRIKKLGNINELNLLDMNLDLPSRFYYLKDDCFMSKKGKKKLCKTKIQVTKEFCRLLGLYIAEGSSKGTHFSFSFNVKETDLVADVASTLQSISCENKMSKNVQGNSLAIIYSSKPLALLFRKLCGAGARQKHLPSWWCELKDECLIELLKGIWLGDGTTQRDGFSITSFSKTLLEQLRLVYNRLGIVAGVYPTSIRVFGLGIKKLEKYWQVSHPATSEWGFRDFAHITENYIAYRIYEKNEEAYSGNVYNFEVEPDNSYLILGYTAHNCQHEYGLYQGFEAPFFTQLRMGGKPIVTTMHSVGSWEFDVLISGISNKVIVHNEFCKSRFPFPNTVIIPHGCTPTEPTPREQAKQAMSIEKTAPVVGYLGFISNYKGLENLIMAMVKVPNAGLLICGGWHTGVESDYIHRLQEWSKKLLGAKVKWAGYVPDDRLADAYGAMDILVYPSRFATESGALLHGLAYGKAIIASNIEPFKEKEKEGALTTFKDSDDLAEKIDMLLKDAKLREDLEAGARKFAQKCSWTNIAKQHIALYEQILHPEG